MGALPFTDAASARNLLRLLDKAFLPAATLSTTPPTRIRFARVSAAAKSPVGYLFDKKGDGGQLSVRDKLTGNELFNFAALLRPSWRANDWMWGRLDAAAHLVELLTEPDRLRQFAPPGPPEPRAAHLAEQVRRAVTSTDS